MITTDDCTPEGGSFAIVRDSLSPCTKKFQLFRFSGLSSSIDSYYRQLFTFHFTSEEKQIKTGITLHASLAGGDLDPRSYLYKTLVRLAGSPGLFNKHKAETLKNLRPEEVPYAFRSQLISRIYHDSINSIFNCQIIPTKEPGVYLLKDFSRAGHKPEPGTKGRGAPSPFRR